MAGSPPDIDALDPEGLKQLCLQLLEGIAALRAENAALRQEIARPKGLKGAPSIKPSGMDKDQRILFAMAKTAEIGQLSHGELDSYSPVQGQEIFRISRRQALATPLKVWVEQLQDLNNRSAASVTGEAG